MVDSFFPYSQKKLGFDKPATIVFQSDDDNASRMLGKTAYYNPEAQEVVLYTDNRHPKDIMRSLSHELVHHAQNCRGDFTNSDSTYEGYAQKDPHLRNMEREAYTKGNLIFRDFEDLIKTGKINIEIDFSDSGEPKMSLKEWKNNEINSKLMKKWGLLKEEKGEPADVAHADRVRSGEEAGEDAAEELEEADRPDHAGHARDEDDLDLTGPLGAAGGPIKMRALSGPDDPRLNTNPTPEYAGTKVKPRRGSRSASAVRGAPRENQDLPKKISVKEAKQITRRIIERIKKESK